MQTIRLVGFVEVLGGKRGDESDLLRHLAELRLLIDESQDGIRSIQGINHDLFLRWVASVSQAMSPLRLANNWKDTRNSLERTTLQALEFAASELARHHQERVIPGDQIDTLLGDLAKAVESVVKSSIEPALKEILMRELERLRLAVLSYRIRGADALRQAPEHTVGVLVLNKEVFARSSDEPELRGSYKVVLWALAVQLGLGDRR